MTRLTSNDLTDSVSKEDFNLFLQKSLGIDVFTLVARSWDIKPESVKEKLYKKKMAAITITSGEGSIEGFAETVCETGSVLGLDARIMKKTDKEGIKEALHWGADLLIYSDDDDFVCEDPKTQRKIHNNPATSRAFVAALETLEGGSLDNKTVIVLGLGPVGAIAAVRLLDLGANPLIYDTIPEKVVKVASKLPGVGLILDEKTLGNTLRKKSPLIFEAVPEKKILHSESIIKVLENMSPKVAAPGVPVSWPLSWLNPGKEGRLFHEPLMAGTASMLGGLLVENYLPEYGLPIPQNLTLEKEVRKRDKHKVNKNNC